MSWRRKIQEIVPPPDRPKSIYKAGDVVRLKCGGRDMVVHIVIESCGRYIQPGVHCSWHDETGRPMSSVYRDEHLVKVSHD